MATAGLDEGDHPPADTASRPTRNLACEASHISSKAINQFPLERCPAPYKLIGWGELDVERAQTAPKGILGFAIEIQPGRHFMIDK
jgi:hypothetical protein